ncbi:MAG: V-type ATP synthase subunit E [bacterium]
MEYNQNVEILSRVIMNDAYLEAEAIIEKARSDAASIRENGIITAHNLKHKNIVNVSQVKLSGSKGKVISLAEFRARSEILGRKEEILQGVLWQVQRAFYAVPKREDYPEIVHRLIGHALGVLYQDGEAFACRTNLRDQALLSAAVMQELSRRYGKRLGLDETPVEITGGVIVYRADFRVLYDNSLEAIFERNRQQMRCMAAECIFGKE